MKDTQNITIVMLLVSAVLLTVMLVAAYNNTSQEAYAKSSVKQGDYIMVNGDWSSSVQLLYVVDIAANKLNVYFTSATGKDIKLIQTVDLDKAFK